MTSPTTRCRFLPSDRTVEVACGTELLSAAREAGVEIASACGGEGTCGSCAVRVIAGQVDAGGLDLLSLQEAAQGYVLACQSRLLGDLVAVEVSEPATCAAPADDELVEGQIDVGQLVSGALDPITTWRSLTVPAAMADDGLSDFDRLSRSLAAAGERTPIDCPLRALRRLPEVLRAAGGVVTVTAVAVDRSGGPTRLIDVQAGHRSGRHLALAVDLGTTTVAVELIDLAAGSSLGSRSGPNEQLLCGLDVISRINYARRPQRLEELRRRGLRTINGLLQRLCASRDVDVHEVTSAVISGNPTMVQLLLGIAPEHLRLEPYTPTVLEVPPMSAGEVGIEIHPDGWVCFSPHVGSYVGGDITAGLLCSGLASDSDPADRSCLYLDIGTNGEIVLGNADFMIGCACSAGPAFEGGGIGCGMRASSGAIESVAVDSATGTASCRTIGGGPAAGICGSGMIDLLAGLFVAGWVDSSGKLDRDRGSPSIAIDGRHAFYTIAEAGQTATASALVLSEVDIDNLMRAKAAVYSACTLLLDHVGLTFADLSAIYIAGSFGRFLPLRQSITIGLLPDLPEDRFHFLGNASLAGSHLVAVSGAQRRRQVDLARRITYLDLSNDPAYTDHYMAALFLPHTDRSAFPSVADRMQRGR